MKPSDKRVWRNTDTWRSVAYRYFQDSREWRFLLEENPSYDIRYHPAEGTSVNILGPVVKGKIVPSTANSPGLLAQPDMNLDLRGGVASQTNQESQQSSFFPWDTYEGYVNRVAEYTALALLTPDRTNGYSLDSPQASSDTQRG